MTVIIKMEIDMKKVRYFNNIPEIGDLYLLCTFFKYDNIDIVFICNDDKGNLYLCLCTDAMFNYCCMVRKISVDKILEVLENKISIYQAFKDLNDYIGIIRYEDNKFSYYKKLFDDFEESELPCEDEYLDLDDCKKLTFQKEIMEYSNSNFHISIFDEFVKFAKERYGLNIVECNDGSGLTFDDIFGGIINNNLKDDLILQWEMPDDIFPDTIDDVDNKTFNTVGLLIDESHTLDNSFKYNIQKDDSSFSSIDKNDFEICVAA